jgi:hypothetical protein
VLVDVVVMNGPATDSQNLVTGPDAAGALYASGTSGVMPFSDEILQLRADCNRQPVPSAGVIGPRRPTMVARPDEFGCGLELLS